jgi:hypothetical protein
VWSALIVVLVALVAAGAVLRGWSFYRRRRALATLGDAEVLRACHGVSMKVLHNGAFPGLSKTKALRTRGDLALTHDRFLLTSGRGTLVDLRPGRGIPLSAARCPGPRRLILEGEIGAPTGGPSRYRVELLVDDADAWARELQPFVASRT